MTTTAVVSNSKSTLFTWSSLPLKSRRRKCRGSNDCATRSTGMGPPQHHQRVSTISPQSQLSPTPMCAEIHRAKENRGGQPRPTQRRQFQLPVRFLLFVAAATMTLSLNDNNCHQQQMSNFYVHSFVLQYQHRQHNKLQQVRRSLPLSLSHQQSRSISISISPNCNGLNIHHKHSCSSIVSLAAASRATGTGEQGMGTKENNEGNNNNNNNNNKDNNEDSMSNGRITINGATNQSNNADNDNDTFKNQEEITLMEVDVRHDVRTLLSYDPKIERYVEYNQKHSAKSSSKNSMKSAPIQKIKRKVKKAFTNAFLPEGVTDSYYKYMKWRFIQRFINANVHVFGTQSLLMGLGIQSKQRSAATSASSLGLSAVFNWVLKDALGKLVRMVWASRMGRKFDPDAKRWRYRSSLLFALGNGLEVMTYVYPSFFLLLATMANACKQMSMLTSSATRNALYNSFRDGTRENIGDITAKGEAQIAIVDLFGIISGVCLSRTIGTSVKSVLSVWILLQIFEVFCVYKEIRSVVFRMLNFERLWIVVNKFIHIFNERDFIDGSAKDIPLPTPDMIADVEKIFMPPNHLARRAISFGSLSRAKLSPEELSELIEVFHNEKYILVVGQDLKNKRIKWNWVSGGTSKDRDGNIKGRNTHSFSEQMKIDVQENCHIVLHADATNADIVKSTLALAILRKKLADAVPSDDFFYSLNPENQSNIISHINGDADRFNEKTVAELIKNQRSGDCMNLIRESRSEAEQLFGPFLKVLSARGWATPARFMFGRVSMRTEWPITKR